MSRRQTLTQKLYPPEEFCAAASALQAGFATSIVRLIWEGYDLLAKEVLAQLDVRQASLQLERQVTQLLVPRIRSRLSGFEPYCVEHGPHEFETQHANEGGQPPQYDIAFVLHGNPRAMWPLEGRPKSHSEDPATNQDFTG